MSEVESFCLPALEIMACGGIPIVARVNGVDEFLVNEKNGYLVEQGDLETPREILLDLMNNRKKLEELKEEARKTAKMWNWDRFIDVLDNVLIE